MIKVFWTMVLHLLYQMQDTELRKNGCYYSVTIRASGKASHWNIALKLLKEEKEHDGDVSFTIMDNTMCNACEKADQKLIKRKTLVEHGGERIFPSTPCRERALWTNSRKRNWPSSVSWERSVLGKKASEEQCSAERSS